MKEELDLLQYWIFAVDNEYHIAEDTGTKLRRINTVHFGRREHAAFQCLYNTSSWLHGYEIVRRIADPNNPRRYDPKLGIVMVNHMRNKLRPAEQIIQTQITKGYRIRPETKQNIVFFEDTRKFEAFIRVLTIPFVD